MPTISASTNIQSIQFKEAAAPTTPSSGYGRLYFKTDNTLHILDDTAADINLSAAYGSGISVFGAATRIPYASSATALTSSAGLTYDGTNMVLTGTGQTLGTITSGVWNAGAVTSSGTIAGVAGAFSGQNITMDYNTAASGPDLILDGALGDGSNYIGGVIFKITGTAIGGVRAKEYSADNYGLGFQTYGGGGLAETMRLTGPGVLSLAAYTAATWVAGDRYLVANAAGVVHLSAIGPAS